MSYCPIFELSIFISPLDLTGLRIQFGLIAISLLTGHFIIIIIIIIIKMLRRIFGPKRDENGEWRRLHIEELYSLCRSPNIGRVIKSRRLRCAGHVARMEEGRSAFEFLTGKPTVKRPLGRPRRRSEDYIKMNLEKIGINTSNWVHSAQDRDYWRAFANAALNLRVP